MLPDGVTSFFVNVYRVPPFLLPIYFGAAEQYGVPWQVLAAINEVETNYGHDVGVSSAGAEGWMQFLPAEWLTYGVDANGTGVRDPYNPGDSIFAAARYLNAAGAAHDLRGAIYAYNHSSTYVDSVLLRARLMAGTPPSMIKSLAALVDGHFPVAGDGAHVTTPVWVKPLRARRRSGPAATAIPRSRSRLAPVPSRVTTTTTSASVSRQVIGGASVAASPGASVIAVQDAEVVAAGRARSLGRFIRLRDVFGDTYTYSHLGSVASRYALPTADAAGSGAGSAQQATRVASPRLAPLRRGAWVPAGAVLGKVGGAQPDGSAQFVFELQPAGAGRVDPRPILAAWQLLDQTLRSAGGGAPLFGPDARDALTNEIGLMSQRQIAHRLLSDPDARLSSCDRSDIAAGRVDRRVLSVLLFLVASRADPTVSGSACSAGAARAAASRSGPRSGRGVAVSAIDGVSIRGDHGPGSVTDLVIRRLLTLPAAIRPARIVSPIPVPGALTGQVVRGPADHIEIEFAPAASARASAARQGHTADSATSGSQTQSPAAPVLSFDSGLGTSQWRALLARISQLPEPAVAIAPTSAAVPDAASAPAAGAGQPSALLQLGPALVAAESAPAAGSGAPGSLAPTPLPPLSAAFAPLLGSAGTPRSLAAPALAAPSP